MPAMIIVSYDQDLTNRNQRSYPGLITSRGMCKQKYTPDIVEDMKKLNWKLVLTRAL